MATTVVMQQPQPFLPQAKDWSTGLFHCFRDMEICCLYFWCFWCMTCHMAQKFGDCVCLPLLDMFSAAITSYVCLPMCVPPIGLSMRISVRKRYDIPGTVSDDCPIATFCAPCSWCQMAREIKIQSRACTVISHQPAQFDSPAPPMDMYPPPSYTPQAASSPAVVIIR